MNFSTELVAAGEHKNSGPYENQTLAFHHGTLLKELCHLDC
jgi:hypothetical protein